MKKKITYLIFLTSIFFVNISVKAFNMFGANGEKNVCGLNLPSNVPTFTSGLFNLVKLLVPIILIVMGMVDFAKAVMANDEKKMKESTTAFIRRLIAAVFIFFIVAIVQFVFKKVSSDTGFTSCMNCILSDNCTASTISYKSQIDSIKSTNKTTQTGTTNKTPVATNINEAKKVCEAITKIPKCRANNLCKWDKKTKKCNAKKVKYPLTKKSTTKETSSNSEQAKIVTYARKYATAKPNHPYRYGGTSLCKTPPYSLSRGCKVDCSGFVQQVYAHNGYKCIPRVSQKQATDLGKPYNKNVKLQNGDLLFFYSDLHHVGIYIGNGKYVHASSASTGVIISNINANKPIQRYARIIGNSKCKKS